MLERYARGWALEIEDISHFVHEQRDNALSPPFEHLLTPRERVYRVADEGLRRRLELSDAIAIES